MSDAPSARQSDRGQIKPALSACSSYERGLNSQLYLEHDDQPERAQPMPAEASSITSLERWTALITALVAAVAAAKTIIDDGAAKDRRIGLSWTHLIMIAAVCYIMIWRTHTTIEVEDEMS